MALATKAWERILDMDNSLQVPTVVSYDRRTLPRSLFHEPTLVSAIGHFRLLDHGCGTAFRPTSTVWRYPLAVPPCVKDLFVCLTETPAPSDFLVCYTNALTYLLTPRTTRCRHETLGDEHLGYLSHAVGGF